VFCTAFIPSRVDNSKRTSEELLISKRIDS
jgi:hypothetical protein